MWDQSLAKQLMLICVKRGKKFGLEELNLTFENAQGNLKILVKNISIKNP